MPQCLLETIKASWGWTGLNPASLMAINRFCNVIVEDAEGQLWRIKPEDVSCERIAKQASEFAMLLGDPEFREDWEMGNLVAASQQRWGVPGEGQGFQLVTPSILGGVYAVENVRIAAIDSILSVAGEIARQLQALPDGTKVKLIVTD
jgi:hypothetical protein